MAEVRSLMPRPICGSKRVYIDENMIICDECDTSFGAPDNHGGLSYAIEVWNNYQKYQRGIVDDEYELIQYGFSSEVLLRNGKEIMHTGSAYNRMQNMRDALRDAVELERLCAKLQD